MRFTPRRGAFTIIELLVVIAIIATLAALVLGVSTRVIESQRQANTETAIRTVTQTVTQHWNAVIDEAKKETPSPAALFLAGNDPDRARVIMVKIRLMEAFPASFKEVYWGPYLVKDQATGTYKPTMSPLVYAAIDPTIPGQTNSVPWGGAPLIPRDKGRYMSTFEKTVKSTGSGSPNPDETSALLFMSLSIKKKQANRLEADTLGKNYVMDKGGYPCLVDSWGNSLMFYRFPTGNQDLNSMGKGSALDRLDPTNKLLDTKWYNTAPYAPSNPTTYGQMYSTFFNSINLKSSGTPAPAMVPPGDSLKGSFITPALVSAGRDGQLGLAPDMSAMSASADDNIYSFRLLLGTGTE